MATSITGKPVSVNDQVSIVANVVSVSGTGSKASVTFSTPLSASTFVCQANDCAAVTHNPDAAHAAVSKDGKNYGVKGEDITVCGTVTAISGSGSIATMTVQLVSSLTSISGVPVAAAYSASAFSNLQ